MITHEFAQEFAQEWIEVWNSHDLDRILTHYSEDFSIESPLALKRLPETKGIVSGKENVRNYWRIGLDGIPDLKFELIDILVGINSITLYYLNTATGKKTAELMVFNADHKVCKTIANYTN